MNYFKNKSVFLSGGLGFIGSHMIDKLLDLGVSNLVIVDNQSAHTDTRYIKDHLEQDVIKYYNLDITGDMGKEVSEFKYDVLVHLAAQPDVKISVNKPYFDFMQNVVGSMKMLEFARSQDISDVIFAASGGTVYGEPEINPIFILMIVLRDS